MNNNDLESTGKRTRNRYSFQFKSKCVLGYWSKKYTSVLRASGIISSTIQHSNPYENTIAERVNGILKQEFLFNAHLFNKSRVLKLFDQSIITYNNIRLHWTLNLDTPDNVHFNYIS